MLRSALSVLLLLGSQLLFTPTCLAGMTLEHGYGAFERGDVATAVQIWRDLAEAGDQTAQLNLGQLYRMGKGVAASDEEAVKGTAWLRSRVPKLPLTP